MPSRTVSLNGSYSTRADADTIGHSLHVGNGDQRLRTHLSGVPTLDWTPRQKCCGKSLAKSACRLEFKYFYSRTACDTYGLIRRSKSP